MHPSPGQQHHHALQPLTVEILLILVPIFSATTSDCFPGCCQFYLWVCQIHSFLYFYSLSSVSSFSSRRLHQPCCLALLYSVPLFHITVEIFWVQMKKKCVGVCARTRTRTCAHLVLIVTLPNKALVVPCYV